MFRRAMGRALVVLGALATVALLSLLVVARPFAEPSWGYLISGLLLLTLLWWDILFHLRVLQSPASAGRDRAHRIRNPRAK